MKEGRLYAIFHDAYSIFTDILINSQLFCSICVNAALSSKLRSSMSTLEQIAITPQYNCPISEDSEIIANLLTTLLLIYCEDNSRFLSSDSLTHSCNDEFIGGQVSNAILRMWNYCYRSLRCRVLVKCSLFFYIQLIKQLRAGQVLLQSMRMIEEAIDVDDRDEEYQENKKTKKRKAEPTVLPQRATRRAKKRQSEDECPLPEVIPLSDSNEAIIFQSFEQETTRIILQIPLRVFPGEGMPAFGQEEITRIEATPIQLQIQLQGGNVSCSIRWEGIKDEERVLIVTGKYSWLTDTEVLSKIIKSSRKTLTSSLPLQIVRFRPVQPRSDFFIIFSLRWQQQRTTLYRGLVNQGNTCYMNSYLQMLFHLAQFRYISNYARKLLFSVEVKDKDKFPATLQLLFYKLLQQQKPVSPQELVRSFGWTKKEVQIQQDVQEFSCLFFDALELTLPHVSDLFCGELVHYIQCENADYRTENRERFYDLQLPIANNLAAALDDYVGEQALHGDNAYRTEIFGLQDAAKGLKISFLPPVLMLQLKRFQFNPYTETNQKIMDRCSYPQKMQLSKWTTNPTVQQQYQLYAVLVHEGSQSSSGHYYVYIHQKGQWYRFNDQIVEIVEKARALDYNFGGVFDIAEYDTRQMKVQQKQVQNKSTAYLLVYVSREYRQLLLDGQHKDELPKWLIENTKKKQSLEEDKKLRKLSICDITIWHWEKVMAGRECLGSGISLSLEDIEQQEEKIDKIPKNQPLDKWIEQMEERSEGQQLYLLWNTLDRQVASHIKSRQCSNVGQLFKDINQPTLFFAPVKGGKDDFLVMVKLYDKAVVPSFNFYQCITVPKQSTRDQLRNQLLALLPTGTLGYAYLEDRKSGLIFLEKGDDGVLPTQIPSKNQLLIAVLELCRSVEDKDEVLKLYQTERDNIVIYFREEGSRFSYEQQLSKFLTLAQLREILYGILPENPGLRSPDNIIIKYKAKKGGKSNVQAIEKDTLEELTKYDRTLLFKYSSLSAAERDSMREVSVYFRDDDHRLSQCVALAIKRQQQTNILDLIKSQKSVINALPLSQGQKIRCFLMAKDRSYISDLVEDTGKVPGKGELSALLQRDRNSLLVLEVDKEKTIPEEQRFTIVLHHTTKTWERFAEPRVIVVSRKLTLSELRTLLLQKLEQESYEFEGRIYSFNPFKLRLLAYTKDINKATQLFEQGVIPSQQGEGQSPKPDVEIPQTIESRFFRSRFLRVAAVHNSISKGAAALKLNVQ